MTHTAAVFAALAAVMASLPLQCAAQASSAECGGTIADTCMTMPMGSASYGGFSNATLASCCAACLKDGTLCYGFMLNNRGVCTLMDAWNASHLRKGPCTVAKVNDWPQKQQRPPATAPKGAKNVLFLVADDMRPSLGPYAADPSATPFFTPNINGLSDGGITFTRAYIQFSYCAPSRNSFMSGRRPDATKALSFIGTFRQSDIGMKWASLPEWFKLNGYNVAGSGKLFHPGVPAQFDQPYAWSERFPYIEPGQNATNLCEEECCGMTAGRGSEDPWNYCGFDLKNGTYLSDQVSTMVALDHLRELGAEYKSSGKPFFVGLGFHKPHLPWEFPREYWDRIPAEHVKAPAHPAFPSSSPPIAWHECAECSAWGPNLTRISFFDSKGEGQAPPSSEWMVGMRRGYYAAIAYVDGLIGQTLRLLEDLGLENETVVSLTGDHGWNLGEHDIWCKMTNSEAGTRVPLIFRAPWIEASRGAKTKALSELVDLYPTLAELAGIGLPAGDEGAHLGGTSLVPVFHNTSASVKEVALSQFPRCWQNNTDFVPNKLNGPGDELNHTASLMAMSDCHWTRRGGIDFMGYAIRTDTHRFVEWFVWDGEKLAPKWDEVHARELYDHSQVSQYDDSYLDQTENENLAEDASQAGLVSKLSALLRREVTKWLVS